MNIRIDFKKMLVLVFALIVSILLAVFVPLGFAGIIVGAIIGYFTYPRTHEIIEYFRQAVNEGVE